MALVKTFTLDEETVKKIKVLAERFSDGNESALIRLLVKQVEVQEKISMKSAVLGEALPNDKQL